jgi:hypothetical protein
MFLWMFEQRHKEQKKKYIYFFRKSAGGGASVSQLSFFIWTVHQLADLFSIFRTTHEVKTPQVIKSRGQHCGDIELTGYLANAPVPVSLVLDLCISQNDSEVPLTLVFMETYTTLMI